MAKPNHKSYLSNGQYTALCSFFNGVLDHPFAVQDMMATIAAGRQLIAESIPVYLLPHALLLHAVAPEPGVVDDVVRLVERLQEEYEQPSGNGPRFWHPNANLVSSLVYGLTDAESIAELPDSAYIAVAYEALTNDNTWSQMFAGLPMPKTGK